AQRSIAGDFVIGQGPPHELQLRCDHHVRVDRRIGGDIASLAQVGQELAAVVVPGPFFELEAQAVDLLVEEPLRIDIAGEKPAGPESGAEVTVNQPQGKSPKWARPLPPGVRGSRAHLCGDCQPRPAGWNSAPPRYPPPPGQ